MANEINIGINTTSDLSGLNQVDESVKSLKTQLKEAQANVAALSDKFGATSKEAIEAAKSAAVLKDKIGDAKSLTDAFNPDAKFKAVSASLVGVAGGFSALQGAIGLFGEESKDVEKAILKVQSAMALASGIQAIGESIDAFKNMKTVAVDAFKAIKGAIGSTGIGLLVVALGTIYAYWDDIKEAVSGVSAEQKKLNVDSQKNVDIANEKLKKIGAQDNILKLQGKTEKEILNLKIKQTDEAIQATKINIKNQEISSKLAVEGAKKNYQMLKSYLDFISMPLKFLYENAAKGINKIIDLVNGIPGVEIKVHVDEKMVDKSAEWLAKLAFDPEQTKKDGEKVIKESKDALTKLENDRAGFKLTQRDNDKKASDEAAANRKKNSDEAKAQLEKDNEILKKSLEEAENLRADTAVKEEELQHKRNLDDINQIKDKKIRNEAKEAEEKNHLERLKEARKKDSDAAYEEQIKLQNEKDAGFEDDLNKQLAHYESLRTIQLFYGKSTIETDKQIKKTKEDLNKEAYQKELDILNAQYVGFENDLVKQQEYNEKKLELQKTYKEKTLETDKALVDGKAKLNKQEIDEKAATIDAVGKMIVAGAEIGNFIADSLKASAGKDKNRQKTAVRVGAASSIAGVIGSTASANAGFLANPASISTMGLAAAAPIATNLASSAIAIAKIISEKNKAIAEIDNTSTDAGGDAAKPTSKFATGGLVTGIGTSTSDSIIANLSNGESVINAKSTAMFGNLLSSINEAGGGVSFANKNQTNPIFKTYVVASEMTSQIEANLKLKQIARL